MQVSPQMQWESYLLHCPRLSAARYLVAKRNVMMRPGGALLNKYDILPHLMAKCGISLQHFGAYLFILLNCFSKFINLVSDHFC